MFICVLNIYQIVHIYVCLCDYLIQAQLFCLEGGGDGEGGVGSIVHVAVDHRRKALPHGVNRFLDSG